MLGCPSYLKRKPRTSSGLRRIPQARYIYISERETSVNWGGCFCCIHRRGKLTGCEIFYQILTTLLASIYVFNLAYPKNWLKPFSHFHPECACRTKGSAGTSFFGQTYFRCIGLTECPHSLFHTFNCVKVGLSRKDMFC